MKAADGLVQALALFVVAAHDVLHAVEVGVDLAADEDFEVVAEAQDGRTAVEMAERGAKQQGEGRLP